MLSPWQQWCVRSNLQRIKEEGLDRLEVAAIVRANGYPTVAQAIEESV